MSSNPAIEVKELSKKFNIGKQTRDIRETIRNLFSTPKSKSNEIWALKDVNFDVNEGEVFGIIGPNGSGKSTLLKILSKITYPTSGKAILRGRVSSLLEVGTGFHHELTGRENIFLNGSILGMSKREIKNKFDEIVDFSGVEKFIDTPVKHYSSGMYVRLAFSVAAHLEPEILLVDEVLSVGDMSFRQKSMGKMNEVASEGRTVILVSHNLGTIKNLCSNGLFLNNGKIIKYGSINDVINSYHNSYSNGNRLQEVNYSSGAIAVNSIDLINDSKFGSNIISCGDDIKIILKYDRKEKLKHLMVKLIFRDINKQALFSCNNKLTGDIFNSLSAEGTISCTIPKLSLNSGVYTIDLYFEENGNEIFKGIEILKFEVFAGSFYNTLIMPYEDRIFLVDHSWSLD